MFELTAAPYICPNKFLKKIVRPKYLNDINFWPSTGTPTYAPPLAGVHAKEPVILGVLEPKGKAR